MCALLNINLKSAIEHPEKQLEDILKELGVHGGLDYVPRERTP
jgi:hypothetical protein